MDWYYVAEGQQVGPMSGQELQALVAAGTVTGETLVWREGMQEWVPQGTVAAEIAADGGAGEPAAGGKTRLALKKQEGAPTAAQPVPDGRGTCRECGRQFPLDEMIDYEGATVCAECKPAFFQRMQEGASALAVGRGTGGQTPNAEIMSLARANLSARWGLVVGFIILLNLLTNAIGAVPIAGFVVLIICGGAIAVGHSTFFLAVARDGEPRVSMMFDGFKRFGTAFLALLLFIVFYLLWALLLVIPGIIAAYRYSLTFYILADDENIGALDAINRSKELMMGNKGKLFCLHLRFFGWMMLCMVPMWLGMASGNIAIIIVCMLGAILGMLLWVQPWMMVAMARFYDDVLPPA